MKKMKTVFLSIGKLRLTFACCFLALFSGTTLLAQTLKEVSGKVADDKGETLPGVSVQLKGGTSGTLTDVDGNFKLNVPEENAVLVISFLGFTTKEVSVGTQTTLNIVLGADTKSLEEVVVVGYGTQKRVNLTGSVGTVSGEKLLERPAPNAANLLQGRITGLQVSQPSGEPGRDNPTFLIRGKSSFGGSSNPLVLIDGVTGSFNNLSPNDIENVTVLKDAASAAIYGARAANGVILVTTKKGKKGKTQFSYNVNVGRHNPTALPDLITNSAEYMRMYNRAAERSGIAFKYDVSEIEKYRSATDRTMFPNFDNVDYYMNPATVTSHNLSVNGGGEKNRFNLSLGYLDQNAIYKGYNFKRYNALLNYENDLTKHVTVGTIMNLTYKDRNEPPFTGENMTLAVYAAGPLYGPFLPDGSGRIASRAYQPEGRNRNPQEYYAMGDQTTKEYNANAQAYINVVPFKGLTWRSTIALNYIDEFYKMHQRDYDAFLFRKADGAADYTRETFGPDILGVTDQYRKEINPTFYSTLTYDTKIGENHNLKFLAGYEQLSNRVQGLRGRRINSVAQELDELGGYLAAGESLFFNHPRLPGNIAPQEWSMQSFFGRVNYDFKGKYLLEANLRYDGTSKVSPDYRWGVFPSVSAGWIISQEDFFRDNVSWVDNFKLRASYGTLGNQDVGTYLYQDNLTINGVLYPFGNSTVQQGAVNNTFRDQSIRWESSSVLDFGLDLEIKRGLLGVTFDWFRRSAFDILSPPQAPLSLGVVPQTINNGEMRSQGVELELYHRNKIGDFNYGANFQISTARNKVTDIKIPRVRRGDVRRVGDAFDAHYLFEWDGIFQVEDIGNPDVPVHALNPSPKAGDLKMKDQNGDNIIDDKDLVVVDGAYPDFIYSFGLNAGYKRFNLTAFFQGVEGLKSRVNNRGGNWLVDPFMQGTAPTTKWRNAWTPENRSNTMPGIYASNYAGVINYLESTYYLQDASYLRLKNVQLSYSVPNSLISKWKLSDLNVYVSADNLFTITDYENGDPERTSMVGNMTQYPQVKIFNVGLNVRF